MKRGILFLILVVLLAFGSKAGADSYSIVSTGYAKQSYGDMYVEVLQMVDADANDTIIYTSPDRSGFYLYSVETWPGSTAPTDASDLVILDSTSGADMLGLAGVDIIDATTSREGMPVPTQGNTNAAPAPRPVTSALTYAVNNNNVSNAVVNVKSVFKRVK